MLPCVTCAPYPPVVEMHDGEVDGPRRCAGGQQQQRAEQGVVSECAHRGMPPAHTAQDLGAKKRSDARANNSIRGVTGARGWQRQVVRIAMQQRIWRCSKIDSSRYGRQV